jgi:hypothetical protein
MVVVRLGGWWCSWVGNWVAIGLKRIKEAVERLVVVFSAAMARVWLERWWEGSVALGVVSMERDLIG